MESSVDVWRVTPDLASGWLRNGHQRQIDLLKVRMMLRDMEAGVWDLTRQEGNPIIIRNGACIDGHHRLLAILMRMRGLENIVEIKG